MTGGLKELVEREGWWANWLGFVFLALVFVGTVNYVPNFGTWNQLPGLYTQPYSPMILLLVSIGVLCSIAMVFLDEDPVSFAVAFPAVFLLAMISFAIESHTFMESYGLSYALWALLLGLFISNSVTVPSWMDPAVQSELYIKVGLVLLGARIVFWRILRLGQYGVIVAWVVTPIVLLSMFWFGWKYLDLSPEFSVTISAATSVCGVSAAIAAAESCRAKKEELTLAVGMTLIFTVAMMVGMPLFVEWIGFNHFVGGAWLGGTIDSTGAVAAAGEFLGPDALDTATVIKMIQNVLIGMIAFLVAIFWVIYFSATEDQRPGLRVIWDRFPRFILGFVAASLVASFLMVPLIGSQAMDAKVDLANGFRGWFFCLAFLCIGLETNFRSLWEQIEGGRPLILYVVGQSFNVLFTLLVAWLVFRNFA